VNAARLLDEWGVAVVAVSDVNGAASNPAGLDPQTILSHDEEPEAVTDYAEKTIDTDELLTLDVDLLIIAASGDVYRRPPTSGGSKISIGGCGRSRKDRTNSTKKCCPHGLTFGARSKREM